MSKEIPCLICEKYKCGSCNQYTELQSESICRDCKQRIYYCDYCQKKIAREREKNLKKLGK